MGNSRFEQKQYEAEINARLKRLQALDAEYAQLDPTAAPAAPKPKSKNASIRDIAHDWGVGTITGINKAVSQALKVIPEIFTGEEQEDDFLGIGSAAKSFADRHKSKTQLQVGKLKMDTQDAVAPIVDFMTAFVPVAGATGKILRGVGWANKAIKTRKGAKVVKATVDGAITSGIAMDQYEERLSNLINSKTGGPISEFLKADPEDHPTVARLKTAAEDAIFGVFAEAGLAAGSKAAKHLVDKTVRGLEYVKARTVLKQQNPSAVAAMDSELERIKADLEKALTESKTRLLKGSDTPAVVPNVPDQQAALDAFRSGGGAQPNPLHAPPPVSGIGMTSQDIFDRMLKSVEEHVDVTEAAKMREDLLAQFRGGGGGAAVPEQSLGDRLAKAADEVQMESKVPYSGNTGEVLDLPEPAIADELNLPARESVVDEIGAIPNKHLIDNSMIRDKVLNRGHEGIIEYLDDIRNRMAPDVDPYALNIEPGSGGLLDIVRGAEAIKGKDRTILRWQAMLGDVFDTLKNQKGAAAMLNGSGESSASIEAIRRAASEAKQGQVRYVLDVRTGNATPLKGVDSVDTVAQAGKVVVQEGIGKGGKRTVLSMGSGVNQGQLSRWGLGNQRGKVSMSALLPTMAGTSGGFFIDYNGDGEHDWEDLAIGFMLGVGSTAAINVGRKIFHGEDKEALEALLKVKAEKLADLDATEAKIKEAMRNVHVDEAKRGAWKQDLETIAQIRKFIERIENPKMLATKVRDANAVANFKPVVQISEETVKAIVKDMKDGNLPKMLEGIDFNFANLVHPDDAEMAIKQLTNLISIHADTETQKAMRGVVGWDSTEAMASKIANDYGMSLTNVNQLFKSTKGLDHRFLAAEMLNNSVKVRLRNLMDEVTSIDPPLEKLNELDQMVAFSAAIQAQVKGSQAEIARVMNAMKIAAKVRKNLSLEGITPEQMQALRQQMGGAIDKEAKMKAVATLKKLMDAGDTKKVNRYLRGYTGNPTLKFINELHRTVMLTAPPTHIANATGSILTTIGRFIEGGLAELYQGKFSMPQTRAMAEGLASFETFQEAMSMALEALKKGESGLSSATKLDDPVQGISYDVFKQSYIGQAVDWVASKLGLDSALQKSIDTSGTVLRGTFNALTGTDEFFKVLNYRMSLHKLAYNQAFEEAIQKGTPAHLLASEVGARKIAILEAPTEELFDRAVREAETATFNNTPEGLMGSFAKVIGRSQALQLVVPFSKTPANLINYVFERTPLDFFSQQTREILTTGTAAQKAEILARVSVGSFLITAAMGASYAGLVTGGADRDMTGERTSGWQPYSFHIGGKYYSFDRFDPLTSFLGLGADIQNIVFNSDEDTTVMKSIEAALISISRNITSKTMLQGLVEALDLLRAGDRTAETYVKKFVTSFIPAVSTAVEKTVDPTLSATISLIDEIKAKIPGLSSTLPPRLDILGDPIKAQTVGPAALSPIKYSEDKNDPVRQEIARLNIDTAARLRGMKKLMGVELTPEQYHKYLKLNGEMLKEDLAMIVESPDYQDAPEDAYSPNSKIKMIKDAMDRASAYASIQLLEEDTALADLLEANKERALEGLKPLQQGEEQ